MILYKDDPKLGIKVITTVGGQKEYARNCKYIQEKYYRKDDEVFEVAGQWYRVVTGKIVLDHEKKEWVLKSNHGLLTGIVSFEKGAAITGSFSPNLYTNCKVAHRDFGNVTCINSDILRDNGYIEDVATCRWFDKKTLTSADIKRLATVRNEVNHHNKGYNIEDNAVEFDRKKQSYAAFPTKISKDVRKYGKYIGGVTYGAEIETSEGNLPDAFQYQTGIVICRDGSISSAEYVTVPMSGPKGIQNLVNISKELVGRTNIDMGCSLHYHIGNISLDRLHLITLYLLGYKVQDDVFKMFPYYKTDHRGVKKKNYCQKLKKMSIHPLKDFSKEGYAQYIEEVYVRIYTFLSDGHPPDNGNNRRLLQHPIAQKFNRPSRYYWLNLQNMIFSERGTAEFRLHTATTNSVKMTAWLFMCVAMVKYAEANVQTILSEAGKVDFVDVLNYYRDHFPGDKNAAFLSEYLIAYYKSRCAVFAKDVEKDDKLSAHDLDGDKKFTFSHEGVTLF